MIFGIASIIGASTLLSVNGSWQQNLVLLKTIFNAFWVALVEIYDFTDALHVVIDPLP